MDFLAAVYRKDVTIPGMPGDFPSDDPAVLAFWHRENDLRARRRPDFDTAATEAESRIISGARRDRPVPALVRRSGNQGGACVETRLHGERVQIRDAKLGESSPILSASHSEWAAILGDLKRLPPAKYTASAMAEAVRDLC